MDRVGAHFDDPRAAVPFIEALGLPAAALDWPVTRLSSGERQRLALARSLVGRPAVLLLDEPTAALDEESVKRVEWLLRGGMGRGTSILLVTHAGAQAERLAHRRLRMEKGELLTPPPAPPGEGGAREAGGWGQRPLRKAWICRPLILGQAVAVFGSKHTHGPLSDKPLI